MCMMYFKGKRLSTLFPIEKNPNSILYIFMKNIVVIGSKLILELKNKNKKESKVIKNMFYIGSLYEEPSIYEDINKKKFEKKTIFDDLLNLPNELKNKAEMLAEWARGYSRNL